MARSCQVVTDNWIKESVDRREKFEDLFVHPSQVPASRFRKAVCMYLPVLNGVATFC
jgi:hypothetical protein